MYIYSHTYERLEKHYNYELTDDEWVEPATAYLQWVSRNNNTHKSIKSTQAPIISTSHNMYHTPKIGTQIFNMDKWINMEDKTWPSPHGTLILCNLKMSFFFWTCLMCSIQLKQEIACQKRFR